VGCLGCVGSFFVDQATILLFGATAKLCTVVICFRRAHVLLNHAQYISFFLLLVMSPDTSTCPGCDKTFSVQGYESHLAQSKDLLCRAAYEELKTTHEFYERFTDSDSDTEDQPFQEDALGSPKDYINDIFLGQVSAEEDEPREGDDSEDEEELVAELEPVWEPPREGAPVDETEEELVSNINPQEEGSELENNIGSRRAAEHVIINEGLGVKPAVVLRYSEKYPSSAAGKALAHGETTDQNYRATFSGQDKNPWAPFSSEKDWELALWSKVRGPGSTAFSELIAIPGVCF
jgi:hypothetical protein